jgi:glycosyltransferase involved in cell wall biosynthesis
VIEVPSLYDTTPSQHGTVREKDMAEYCLGTNRILIVTKSFRQGFGGTPESVLLLARNLSEIGVVCDVASDEGLTKEAHLLKELPSSGTRGASLTNIAMESYAGLFIAGPWLFRALGLTLRAKLRGVPVSYAPKGALGSADFARLRDIKKVPYLLMLEIFLLLLAQKIVFSSPEECNNCIVPSIVWRRKQVVVPEPFAPSSLSRAAPKRSGPPVLGFLAEIRPLKGLRELVEAMAMLGRYPGGDHIRLRIAGIPRPGSERYFAEILAFIERNGLTDRIEWIGRILGDEQRTAFYDSLDVFVCPSKSESFGYTPLEALWHGLPVVMGANIGVRAFIPKGAPVATFTKIEPEEIATGIWGMVLRVPLLREEGLVWRERQIANLGGKSLAKQFMTIFARK